MLKRLALLGLGVSLLLLAQSAMTVQQLIEFVRSSIELKQPDKQVAAYLRKVKLSERLEDRTIEELQGQGAGPKTIEALHELRDATSTLPAAPPPQPKGPPPAPIPPPSAAEQKRILDQARDYALNYSKRLPDYLCTQVTRRYLDPTGLEFWRQQDVLTARLSYFEQKENYKLILVNNHMVTGDVPLQAVGGSMSTGEFGSLMREIFLPETETDFRWERWGKLRGRVQHVFTYRVAQARSKWHVTYGTSNDIVPGYHGLVYIDKEDGTVARITMVPEVPVTFPLQDISDTLDYDVATIGGQSYMLPLKAEMRMREGKMLAKNDIEFRLYRKFTAEAQITFDTPDPLPEEKTKEQPPK